MKNKKVLVGGIISVLVSLQFAFSAAVKLFPAALYPEMAEGMAKMGLPETLLPTLAALELLCVITYLIPATSVLGAVLFTGYLGGAILTHLRIGEAVYLHILLGGLIWLGIYLREPRLHSVLPIRKKNS